MALQPVGVGDEVLSELREGRTRELLMLLQDKPVPEVVDPLNIQSGLSSNYTTDGDGDYILESTATDGYATDKFSAPTTAPADFKAWNAIQARDVSEGGSTSDDPVEFNIVESAEQWKNVASISEKKEGTASFFDGTYAYTTGGHDTSNDTTDTAERYDPDADEWTDISPLNTGRKKHGAFYLNGNGYVFGGRDEQDSTEKYDTDSDDWTNVASMSVSRRDVAGFSDGTYGYATGGYTPNEPLNTVEQYDPDSDSWSDVASFSTDRYEHAAFFDGEYGYVVSGYDDNDVISSVERYDPNADEWTEVASVNTARRTHAAFFDGEYGYIAGGRNADGDHIDSVERYDPDADEWVEIEPLQKSREEVSAFFDGEHGYVVGGGNGEYEEFFTSVEQYNEEKTTNNSRIPKARIADEPFVMRNRVYSEDAGSDDQSDFTISETGNGGHFGIPILTVSTVKLDGSLIDSANWEYDDDDTVTIDTGEVTISEGDTVEIKYDFDVFDETLQPRAYLSREDTDEESPSISHFRYEYVI